ncbi:MAG TPA: heparan-alpha-glucosaminide N-acetyltransferase [Burkholderiaceae bacterium]|nr:heparan-alpha-glucosaminide N-acetyltransferase [Burkholderiaceae bacterium]
MTLLEPIDVPAVPATRRFAGIDALRGFAVAQMIAYHFIYDLNYFGWLHLAMTRDQPWLGWRTAIVTQFLLLVGASLVLRHAFKPAWSDFWRRWVQIAGAALLVSAGSWWVFRDRFIYFGILHYIAVGLILARLLVPLGRANIVLGIIALLAGVLFKDTLFDPIGFNWLGFTTHKPRTEDYVPLFPWLGVTLIGVGLGASWQRARFAIAPALQGFNDAPPRALVFLGTWALTIYLLHQPLLFGLLWAIRTLTG